MNPELRKYLEEQARLNFRSVSAEAAMRIERTRQEDQAKQQQGAEA
ncbi:hypothetical protein [Delftia acidovorans]|nr:hypothetical protein [Delftia acidovorans]